MYVRQSFTELHDSFFELSGDGKNMTFYTIPRSRDLFFDASISGGKKTLISVQFRLDSNVDTYYR